MKKVLSAAIVHALLLSGTSLVVSGVVHAQPATLSYQVQAGDLDTALKQFASQSRIQLIYDAPTVEGKDSAGLTGSFSSREALRRLLDGKGLSWDFVDDVTVVIKKAEAGVSQRPARASASTRRAPESEEIVGMPAIMVQGARTLNMDITRTEDDPQPYVVFDKDLIERSGATSLEQFLQQRLPMNTNVASMGAAVQMGSLNPGSSGINLRGLGAGQTLILVDGHRMSGPSIRGASSQGDISGIPLAAVERIEILPSTASGIYGGSATGGVINIITRKDYTGGEVRVSYDNTFSSDSAIRKVDFTFGHNFNRGRTSVLLSASHSDANDLTEADRGFVEQGRSHARANNPDYFMSEPPVGRRPNFASVDGSELVLKSGAALGTSYGSVPAGYAGVAGDGGAGLLSGAGAYDWSLPDGASGRGRVLYTEPTLRSGGLVLRHQFSEKLQAFVDLSSSESRRQHLETSGGDIEFTLPADSAYNPFTTDIRGFVPSPVQTRNHSVTRRDRAVVGVIKQLAADWQMSVDYTWDRTRVDFVTSSLFWELGDAIGAGGIDILRDPDAYPIGVGDVPIHIDASMQSTMKNASLRMSGPLGNLPGGRPVLSASLAHRKETAPDAWWIFPAFGMDLLYPARSASVRSAYVEYRVPLFSGLNARPGLRELELQFAVRREEYASRSAGFFQFWEGRPDPLPEPIRVQNAFSSVDPTIAFLWKPVEDVALRMSYGTGFMPPSLSQLVPFNYVEPQISGLVDPRRGGSAVAGPMLYRTSGNPDLLPEDSKSWSAGLVLTPSRLPGLRLSADYTRIEKSGNIGTMPGGTQSVIDNEDLFPQNVVRGPRLPGDPEDWAGPIIELGVAPLNLASLKLEAWDVQLDYRMDTASHGAFDLFAVATWQPTYAIRLIDGAPLVDYVGVGFANPLAFKANVGATWNLSAWRVGWNVSYFDAYDVVDPDTWNADTVIAAQGNGGKVSSQIYHDVFFNYDFALSNAGWVPAWLGTTQVQLGVRNLFDKRPPVDMAVSQGHAYYSPFGNPRLASYYLTLVTRF